MADKKILLACGAGFATSTAGESKVQDICDELGIEADIIKRRVGELTGGGLDSMGNIDLIVLMTPADLDTDVPTVNGVPFISGVNKKQTIEEIKEILSE